MLEEGASMICEGWMSRDSAKTDNRSNWSGFRKWTVWLFWCTHVGVSYDGSLTSLERVLGNKWHRMMVPCENRNSMSYCTQL